VISFLVYCFRKNIQIHERRIVILLINEKEATKLREIGYGKYINKSQSKHPKYYVVESRRTKNQIRQGVQPTALECLEKYRLEKTIQTKN
jgi:hypothetical protein